jgi:Rieske Fe-S protein
MSMKFERREILKGLLALPVIGAISSLFISPFVRYLKPSSGPLATMEVMKTPDKPLAVTEVAFGLNEFPEPWSFKYFMFQEANREYTSVAEQIKTIPGAAVRLPSNTDGNPDFVVFSRVCPHLGCVFNFVPQEDEVAKGYNYTPKPGQKVFACPCHLSVYDPMQTDSKGQGKVVSGPAPRSPFKFNFAVDNSQLVIKSLESGGIS